MSKFGWDYPAGCSSVPGDELEIPETCPMCGEDNQNEEGEAAYDDDPAYCSEECAFDAAKARQRADRLEAEAMNALLDDLGELPPETGVYESDDDLIDRVCGPELPFIPGARVRYVSPDWGECIGEVLRVDGDQLLVQDQHHHGGSEWWPASRCAWVMP
jgi:predicted nucleic acid-binding Zn ribbon protein